MKGFQSEASNSEEHAIPLVIPLSALHRTMLSVGGGKAVNLGELIQAGFTVPAGFCITTAAYERVATQAALDTYLFGLEAVSREDQTRQMELATSIRTALGQTPLPPEVVEAITQSYQTLSTGSPIPVSVRSSATAEDLPGASFAGQQETFLNVVGIEAVLTAVQQCFASLWTDRATQYRASLGLAPRDVRLAVVVQRMVEAEVAGVLFTANPLTGKRQEAVIDANPGLGEAVVSGASNPDHFVVHSATGEIVEHHLGDKQVVIQAASRGGTHTIVSSRSPERSCLSVEQIRALAALGARVEAWYGTPQDIEWAIDTSGQMFLLQARPITTLFPLPPRRRTRLRICASIWLLASSKAPTGLSRPWACPRSASSHLASWNSLALPCATHAPVLASSPRLQGVRSSRLQLPCAVLLGAPSCWRLCTHGIRNE